MIGLMREWQYYTVSRGNLTMQLRLPCIKSIRFYCSLFLMLALATSCGQPQRIAKMDEKPIPEFDPLVNSMQCVVATTADWGAVNGELRLFERDAFGGAWRMTGDPIKIVVGRNGMAWGDGLHPEPADTENAKREGDGRSPAGVYRLGEAFGFASSETVRDLRWPYRHVTDGLYCVDDVESARYNQIVHRDDVEVIDWNSAEDMRAIDPDYEWGLVVEHNTHPAEAGRGSCIFIHVWRGASQGTAGCAAMAKEEMASLLKWLDAQAHPLLVQLPILEYERLQRGWNLPKF